MGFVAVRMGSNDLRTWVSDKLMVLLGYSDKSVVSYLIKMGKFDPFQFMELMNHTFFFFAAILIIY